MNWDHVLQNDPGEQEPLLRRIELLFSQQRTAWPALREGEARLPQLRKKTLSHEGQQILVQCNPGRRHSTHAKTDPQTVAARKCFLCPQNMPGEERGMAFQKLVVLPNPYPVLPLHCTIADREHRPQRLIHSVTTLLSLAAAVGPKLAVFYNGPRCGASAPDHFHLQASNAEDIPLLSKPTSRSKGHQRLGLYSFGRSFLEFTSPNHEDIRTDIVRTLHVLAQLEKTSDEPMFNLLVQFQDNCYRALIFPRTRHRPQCYYADGTERIGVSPAVLEMAGLMVVTELEEFDRLDANRVYSIYSEVSLPRQQFELLLEMVL